MLEHMDASENAFFARELDYVKARAVEQKFPGLLARTLIPVDNEVPGDVPVFTWQEFNSYGVAKILSDYANDFPRADVSGSENHGKVRNLGLSFGYSLDEIRFSARTGKRLDQRKATACRRGIETLLDSIAAVGDAVNGLKGLLNITNALSYSIPNNVGNTAATWINHSTLVATKTPDEILADLDKILTYMKTQTKGCEVADTILLPERQYAHIASTARSTTSDTTILEFFRKNHPGVAVIEWPALTAPLITDTDMMVAYRRDPDALQLVMPIDFEALDIEVKGLEYLQKFRAKTGGVVAYYPMSICYGVGI
jgi:hypothetical protein